MRCCPELLSLLPWLLVKLRCCDRQRHRVGRIPLRLVWTISTLSIRLTSANWGRDASTCSKRYNNPPVVLLRGVAASCGRCKHPRVGHASPAGRPVSGLRWNSQHWRTSIEGLVQEAGAAIRSYFRFEFFD